MIKRIRVVNIPVDILTVSSLHEAILQTTKKKGKKIIAHANARLIELANKRQPWLIDFFNEDVDLVMCDGAAVQLAAKMTSQEIPEKIAYNLWWKEFSRFLADNSLSIYLLGTDEQTIHKAAANMQAIAPALKIAGYHHGFFDKCLGSPDNENVVDLINRAKPDVLWVGFGMPLQEKWIKENYHKLACHCIMPCGGAFDFIAGKNRVAPAFFRRNSLEWLYRLMLEPMRLGRRNTIDLFSFLHVVVTDVFVRTKSR